MSYGTATTGRGSPPRAVPPRWAPDVENGTSSLSPPTCKGALISEGRIADGLVLLDEAMLDISAGETSSRVTAWIYCKTIQTCRQVYDVRRAREWTAALDAWCDALPQFTGAYSGICPSTAPNCCS